MSSQEEWIYLDEPLPEIHIREIISVEELLRENPTFVALSDEEIYNHLFVIFEKKSIADAYYQLHKEVTEPVNIFDRFYKYVMYHVNARRKRNDTDEAEAKYFDTLINLDKNPNYKTREKIKAELQDPYEAAEEIENEDKIPIIRDKNLMVKLTASETETDEGMRLETDKEKYDITGGEFRKADYIDEMYITERIQFANYKKNVSLLAREVIRQKDVNMEELKTANQDITKEGLFYKFTESLVPSFQSILKEINSKNAGDIHSLKMLFQMYGRDMEDIDIESYSELVRIMETLEYENDEEEEEEAEEKEKEVKKLRFDTVSYVKIHSLFWKSIMARLLIAKDAPLYSDIINDAISTILAKSFKADAYTPLAQQLEKMEKGTLKLPEFIRDIQLLRHLDERNLLSEFRQHVHNLQETGNKDIFKDLEERIKQIEELFSKTIDPKQAEEKFSSKAFVINYREIENIREAVQNVDETLSMDDLVQNHDDIVHEMEQFVVDLPENDEDIEIEEADDELAIALEHYEKTTFIIVLQELQPILSRIQELTKMPWNPEEFIRILLERTPNVLDTGAAILKIDETIRADIIEKIRKASFEDAIKILPIDQQTALKTTYHKALKHLKEQRNKIFFLFVSYWVLHVQKLILDDLFVLQHITDSPSKTELKGIGFPVEESKTGRAGREGVLDYFSSILHEEGHEIPGIKELVDEYTNKQLRDRLIEGFEYFENEIQEMKQQAHKPVIYEGDMAIEEAEKVYDTLLDLMKQKLKQQERLKPYIKSLQLLPTIMSDAKERHKHILGCCDAQLNSEYQAKNNLSNRLNAYKKYFAQQRIGVQNRPALLFYGVAVEPRELEKEKGKEKEDEMYFTSILKETVGAEEGAEAEWRDIIKESPFFTLRMKEILTKTNREEASQLQNEAQVYIKALHGTLNIQTGKKDEELWNNIRKLSRLELIGVIGQICTDFYDYVETKQTTYTENELLMITDAVQKTKDVLDMLNRVTIPESDYGVYYPLLQYILSRTLCYPGDVNPGGKKITTDKTVKTKFIEDTAKYILKEVKRHIEMRSTPTLEEIEKRISEIREKNKMKSLERYEQNPELGKLLKQAKNQGIKIDVDRVGEAGGIEEEFGGRINMREDEDERADYQGAREFEPRTEDPDERNIDDLGDY